MTQGSRSISTEEGSHRDQRGTDLGHGRAVRMLGVNGPAARGGFLAPRPPPRPAKSASTKACATCTSQASPQLETMRLACVETANNQLPSTLCPEQRQEVPLGRQNIAPPNVAYNSSEVRRPRAVTNAAQENQGDGTDRTECLKRPGQCPIRQSHVR